MTVMIVVCNRVVTVMTVVYDRVVTVMTFVCYRVVTVMVSYVTDSMVTHPEGNRLPH